MVQKTRKPPASSADAPAPKRRGRPRAYQPEVALGKALDLFRKDGFAATSLDDLSAATGMNRPSLYGAFGDKRELYIKSYQRYRADARAAMIEIFRDELPIRKRLQRIYAVALDIYLSGEAGPRGCFTVMTAASEAVADPDIRAMVLEGFSELDKASLPASASPGRREFPQTADPWCPAQLASASMHTIVRSGRGRACRARSWKRSPGRNCDGAQRYHRRASEHRAKSLAIGWIVDPRSATLLPRQGKLAVGLGAINPDVACGRRERAILGCIGREFMQQQRESRHHTARQPEIGPLTATRGASASVRPS